MDAITYFKTHGRDRCAVIAQAAGTQIGYFMQCCYGHRRPSPELAQKLVEASGGELDFALLLKPKT